MRAEARFPNTASNGKLAAIAWQEYARSKSGGVEIYISISTTRDGISWNEHSRFAGPFVYQKSEAPIFSMVIDHHDRILIAIPVSEFITTILFSEDEGRSFKVLSEITAFSTTIDPAIFVSNDGGYLLFVVSQTSGLLALFFSQSDDGVRWTDFRQFVLEEELILSVLPHHVAFNGREYVVFQSRSGGSGFQLYMKMSDDGGQTWGVTKHIEFNLKLDDLDVRESSFVNQRPFLAEVNGRLGIAWEAQYKRRPPQILYSELDRDGNMISEPEQVTDSNIECHFPQIITANDKLYLLWYDNRRGDDHVIFAERSTFRWEQIDFARNISGTSRSSQSVKLQDHLYVFWENRIEGTSRLLYRSPDRTVNEPQLLAVNYSPTKKYRSDVVRIKWTVPPDTSGIAGFAYSWSTDSDTKPERNLMLHSDVTSVALTADLDGKWFFNLSAMDFAGNWSRVNTIPYVRDTTPPAKVVITEPEKDENGYLVDNSFILSWSPPKEDIIGFSYVLNYLGEQSRELTDDDAALLTPPGRIITYDQIKNYRNLDNGYYAFAVSAVDSAGNIGEASTIFLQLNSYIAITYISSIDKETDELGNTKIGIYGRGFTDGGYIQQIILDVDGRSPFDYRFDLESGIFQVKSDRVIGDFNFPDLEEGKYYIGLMHPERGLYLTKTPLVDIEKFGTVKFGYFTIPYEATWQKLRGVFRIFTVNEIQIWLSVFFLLMVGAATLRKGFSLVREGQVLKWEILWIMRGGSRAERKEKRMQEMRKRGVSLRLKFILLMTILVVLIVMIVSLPLGYYMIGAQRRNLSEGLQRRAEVLLASMAAAAEENLSVRERLELALLPNQISGMEDEFLYVTITGEGERVTQEREEDPGNFEVVWGTNDPDIKTKIDGEQWIQGESKIQDDVSSVLPDLMSSINERAREKVSEISVEVDDLAEQALKYVLQTDVESQQRYEQIGDAIFDMNRQIIDELNTIGAEVYSTPKFDPEEILPRYTFYKPVLYRVKGEDFYYRGLVRLAVSTLEIQREIVSSRDRLIIQTGIIALIAMVLGVLGAIFFASITVIPIKKLAVGVATIRDTEDKEDLKSHVIEIRSKDEIGVIADTVNQMTQALVKAAAANKELTVGKEVQKMFIPLEKDPSGEKSNTGEEVNDAVEIFGFYEGAKGVSGDYFDYVKLDDKNYAIIKCDVAGKGVPAALIMVEVATIFSTYFRNWQKQKIGKSTEEVVYRINDILEERGFKGRFAALTICILNIETGVCYFTNAGDNILHFFSNKQQRAIQKKMPEAPAAGVFPSMLVEMQSGFKQVTYKLNPGDSLFLFTDGLEEAERKFHDADMNIIACEEQGVTQDEYHGGTHKRGEEREELGLTRIYDIINAFHEKGKYRLVRHHTPTVEDLTFDFSSCEGNLKESVLALIAVEKIFRIYQGPNIGQDDKVNVDKHMNAFLSEHFDQYSLYFNNPVDGDDQSSNVQFSYLTEDEQYDDLTILAIKKR